MRDKARTGGGRRDDTCVHGLSRSWKVKVWAKKKKKKILDEDNTYTKNTGERPAVKFVKMFNSS